MLRGPCLCVYPPRHVCLQAVKITASPASCVHYVQYVSVFFGDCEDGPFSMRMLSSYWCTYQNMTPLRWCHICFLCAQLICAESVGSGLCYTVLWLARQCIGVSAVSSHEIFYNFHVRILKAKFLTSDLQLNFFLALDTMGETAVVKTN